MCQLVVYITNSQWIQDINAAISLLASIYVTVTSISPIFCEIRCILLSSSILYELVFSHNQGGVGSIEVCHTKADTPLQTSTGFQEAVRTRHFWKCRGEQASIFSGFCLVQFYRSFHKPIKRTKFCSQTYRKDSGHVEFTIPDEDGFSVGSLCVAK